MRVVLQRVQRAKVTVGSEVVGEIGPGLLLLLGIHRDDGADQITRLAEKLANLRIFEDGDGKMNRSIVEANGSFLVVSQFTLYGDCLKGRRPSFVEAARPEVAEPLYREFVDYLKRFGLPVETGRFGADMLVELAYDGPVTMILDAPPASHAT